MPVFAFGKLGYRKLRFAYFCHAYRRATFIIVEMRVIDASEDVESVVSTLHCCASLPGEGEQGVLLPSPKQPVDGVASFLEVVLYLQHVVDVRRIVLQPQQFPPDFLPQVPLLRPEEVQFFSEEAVTVVDSDDLILILELHAGKTLF